MFQHFLVIFNFVTDLEYMYHHVPAFKSLILQFLSKIFVLINWEIQMLLKLYFAWNVFRSSLKWFNFSLNLTGFLWDGHGCRNVQLYLIYKYITDIIKCVNPWSSEIFNYASITWLTEATYLCLKCTSSRYHSKYVVQLQNPHYSYWTQTFFIKYIFTIQNLINLLII